jgi:TPR repeat protein
MTRFLLVLPLLATFTLVHADQLQSSVYNFQVKMAEKGSPEAAFTVGQMYEEGRGVERDPVKALEWYKKAAALKQPDASKKVSELEGQLNKQTKPAK